MLNRTNNLSPTIMDSLLVYTDLYTIPQLCLCSADQDVYQCEVVINSSPLVIANDNVTLDVVDECEASTMHSYFSNVSIFCNVINYEVNLST